MKAKIFGVMYLCGSIKTHGGEQIQTAYAYVCANDINAAKGEFLGKVE